MDHAGVSVRQLDQTSSLQTQEPGELTRIISPDVIVIPVQRDS
jgi:hypothetical protein